MAFKDFFKRQKNGITVAHTPYGNFDLARKSDVEKLNSIAISIQRQTESLTKQQIDDWRYGWQCALNIDNPSRRRLYDVYRDVDIDAHLSGTIGQINGFVKARSFKLKKGEETDEETTELLNSTWFKKFIDYELEARYWGHSLIQLGDVDSNEDGKMIFTSVTLIPRKHVIPEKGRVVAVEGDIWQNGIDYRQPPFSDWLIEVGTSNDLGLYLKAAPHVIPKKNVSNYWDAFAEVFGMPMRIAKTTTRDPKSQRKIEQMMQNMGSMYWGVFPEGTDIEMKESTRSDSYNIYDRRIDRVNSELSKLILYQTMTIDNGSSLSQSQTHLDVLLNLIEQIADELRDVINDQLLPKMALHGFPVKGLRFDWDYEQDYTPEQMTAIETMLLNNFDIEPKFFEDKYGVTILGPKTYGIGSQGDSGDDGSKKSKSAHQPDFFI